MHDVTKRGLALAVATGGLLITGAAPAVSAVSAHPEHQGHAGMKSQPTGGSSHHAAVPVSTPQVKQYAGRHKAPERQAAAPHVNAPRRSGAKLIGRPGTGDCPPLPGTCAPAPVPGGGTPPARMPLADPSSAAGTSAQATNLGSGGLLSGNTVEVPVDAPINVCGLVATVVGGGDHAVDNHCANGPGTAGGPSSSASAAASGSPGALSGNVVQVPVSLPANICGDTVTAVGVHNSAENTLCANQGGQSSSTAGAVATDSPGLVTGNVIQVPVHAPLNLCGITANVVGVNDTAAGNQCSNGGGQTPPGVPGQSVGAGANAVTADSSGAVTGNVVQVPIEAPINACGDSLNVVGVFNSALDNTCVNNTAGGAAANGLATGNDGLATGNVAQLPIDIPTEVCGVVAAVGAYHDTAAGNSCANTGAATTSSSAGTTGESGLVTGTVAQGSVNAPVQMCGTIVGAAIVDSGTRDTTCSTGPMMPPPAPAPPSPAAPVVSPPAPPAAPLFPSPPSPAAPVFVPPVTPDGPGQYYGPHDEITELPHTGADVLGYAGIGAGALVLGAGAVMAARRKTGSAN